jgi:amino acid transporter
MVMVDDMNMKQMNHANQVPIGDQVSIQYVNTYWFIGGFSQWMGILGFTTWGYAGIESLTMMTNLVENPKKDLPFGLAYGIICLFILNLLVTVVSSSLPPGTMIVMMKIMMMIIIMMMITVHTVLYLHE